jgi:repressor LexA
MEKNISAVKERILKHLENKGLSKRSFYQKTGISNGVLDKKTGLTEENIEKYLRFYPEINPTWLMTGVGKMYLSESSTIDVFNEPEAVYETKRKGIPLVSIEAIAGFGSNAFSISNEDIQDCYVVPDFTNIDFMIRIRGSSMYPKYNAGDIVACRILNENSFIQWNKTYVIATAEQGILCKRIKKSNKEGFYIAISDNKEYDPFEIPIKQITGIALVIGVIRLE